MLNFKNYFIFLFQLLSVSAFASSYYWVGNSGNWSDYSNHWATTSGGNFFYSQEPTLSDDVFFDANSFTLSGQSVIDTSNNFYCNNMNWSGALNNPAFNSPGNGTVHIAGGIQLISGMQIQSPFSISFESTSPGNLIDMHGFSAIDTYFNGAGGSWILQNDFNTLNLFVNQGNFYSNNYFITVGWQNVSGNFASTSGLSRGIFLGTSQISVNGNWDLSGSGISLDADSAIIYLMNANNFIFNGDNLIYHDVFFRFSAQVNDDNTFNLLNSNYDMTINGNNIFDTLFLNNTGHTVSLGAGTTQTINKLLEANSAPGNFVTIQSTTPGIQAAISLPPGDTICLNYVSLQDQNAIGGGVFFAGSNSTNVSDNSGWQFSDCTPPITAVWPGDTNHDLITDNFDVLNLGIFYQYSLWIRPGATNNYSPQYCMDSQYRTVDSVNIKHVDCNGDGFIYDDDTVAIFQNYSQTHPARFSAPTDSSSSVAPNIYFAIPPSITPGSTIAVAIDLGTVANQANNIYGIAFTVNYDTSAVVAGSVSVDYSLSWLVSPGNYLHIEKIFSSNGQVDVGMVRDDFSSVTSNGTIARLIFTVKNNANGFFPLSFSHLRMITADGTIIPVNPVASSMYVGMESLQLNNNFSVFPNPANEKTNIVFSKIPEPNSFFTITNAAGEIILSQVITSGHAEIDLSGFSPGMYFVNVSDENGVSVCKLVKD